MQKAENANIFFFSVCLYPYTWSFISLLDYLDWDTKQWINYDTGQVTETKTRGTCQHPKNHYLNLLIVR